MKKLLVIFAISSVLIIAQGCSNSREKIVGIKIYDYQGDYDKLTDKWMEMGINTAFVSSDLAADASFRESLRGKKIKTFLIFPVFQNPELLEKDSSFFAVTNRGDIARDEWVAFVCPSRKLYRSAIMKEAAGMVEILDPEGLSLDFIRQFVYWEKIYPDTEASEMELACFCDSCTGSFSSERGIGFPDSVNTSAKKRAWIIAEMPGEYQDFRCRLITTMAAELAAEARKVKPGIIINVHAVPWRDADFAGAGQRVAGQDIGNMARSADYISPMCYSQMLKRDAGWISSVVAEMDMKAPGKILPSIQVGAEYIDDPFSTEDFGECIDEALKWPSTGVVFFSWPLFQRDSARMKTAAEHLR